MPRVYQFDPTQHITTTELAQIVAALAIRTDAVPSPDLHKHFRLVEVTNAEAAKAVPVVSGGLRP